MANLRNQQLKVFNQWNKGVQNIPATHLINDTAFTKGIDFNITDSTIKPAKGLTSLKELGNTTKAFLKENVKGEDTELQFDKDISYINYADTVYYIEKPKSPLKQVAKDGGNIVKVNALIAKPEVTVATTTDITQSIQTIQNEVYQRYTDLQLDCYAEPINKYYESLAVLTASGVTGEADEFANYDFGTITIDNYREKLGEMQVKAENLKSAVHKAVEETKGEFTQRITQACDGTPLWSEWRLLDESKLTSYNVKYKKDSAYDPLLYEYNLQYIDNYQRQGAIFSVRNRRNLIAMLEAVKATNILKYVPIDSSLNSSNPWFGNTVSFQYYSFQKAIQQSIDTLTAVNTQQPSNYFDNYSDDKANEAVNLMGGAYKAMVVHITIFLLKHIANDGVGGIVGKQVNGDAMTLQQFSVGFTELHKRLVEADDQLRDYNFTTKLQEVTEVSVVAKNTITKAYSAPFTKTIFIRDGFTVAPPNTPNTEYLVYLKLDGSAESTLVDTITSTKEIKPEYPRKGSVIVNPFQIATPHEDFSSIVEYRGAIFLNRENTQEVWYTNPNDPHSMTATSFIKMPQDVKAMKSASAGVFVWTTNNSMYLLTGSPRDVQGNNTLAIKLVGEGSEILGNNAVASHDSLVVWLSSYSIHNTSGFGSADTTKYVWKPPKIDKVVSSKFHHGKVYFLVDTKVDGRQLITYDTSRKSVEVSNAQGMTGLTDIDGELVGIIDHKAYTIGTNVTELLPYDVTLKSFGGYSYDTRLRFHSVTVAHDAKPYSEWNKDYFTRVILFVDGNPVAERIIQGTTATRLDLPALNNTGQEISVQLIGKLNIKSVRVRYSTHDWED